MIKGIENYGVSTIESIELVDSFGKVILTLEQQTEPHNIISIPINNKIIPSNAYDLPKSYNCRNCGAQVYGYKCNYCDTHY